MNADKLLRKWRFQCLPQPWMCIDCGKINPTIFMLKDEVWQKTNGSKDYLCFSCVEKRLGRLITFDDLKPCGATDAMLLGLFLGIRSNIILDNSFLVRV
jgi:hypothetical protein